MELPVYLLTGFLEGGKTSFIKEILKDKDFLDNRNNLLIVCEEGIEEYDEAELKDTKTTIINVENEEDLSQEFLKECEGKYKPDRIFIEYNGMWNLDNLYDIYLPDNWAIAQAITPIDSTTFNAYMGNMSAIMVEQFRDSDLVIFNRCNKDTKKLSLRGSVRSINTRAQVIFELEDGTIDNSEIELPFDIKAEIIEPEDYDFGILYEDMMTNPHKYDNKRVKIKAMAFNPDQYPPKFAVMGRKAMTCCEDDITPLGLICNFENDEEIKNGEYYDIMGLVHVSVIEQYEDELPVIFVEKFSQCEKPENELIYFN